MANSGVSGAKGTYKYYSFCIKYDSRFLHLLSAVINAGCFADGKKTQF